MNDDLKAELKGLRREIGDKDSQIERLKGQIQEAEWESTNLRSEIEWLKTELWNEKESNVKSSMNQQIEEKMAQ